MLLFNQAPGGLQRWLVAGIILSMLTWVIYGAALKGLGDLHVYSIDKQMKQWSVSRPPDSESLKKNQRLVVEALSRDPDNASLLWRQADLLDWQANGLYFWQQPELVYQEALAVNQEAARLRSVSAISWTSIALLKAKLTEFDQQLESSIQQAARLGPWEPWVQVQLTEVGLSMWPKLSVETQNAVMENIGRGLRHKSWYILPIVDKYGKLKLVCEHFSSQKVLTGHCSA